MKGILLPLKSKAVFAVAAALAVAVFFLSIIHRPPLGGYVRYQEPRFLSFEELKRLSQRPDRDWALKKKLVRFWTTPVISNEAFYEGARPHRPQDPRLGPYLRVVSWNIEKSYEMENAIAAFSSREKFEKLMDPAKAPKGSPQYEDVLRQRDKLANADVIVLQEMDNGVKRSGYIDGARELARALKMNYAYGAEHLEIDPVYLGVEKIYYEDGTVDQEAMDYYAVDPKRYKGVFGCAVLSRFPIKRVQVFQLKNQAYDWYQGERPKIGFVEKARRVGAEVIFKNVMTREMKAGGRIYFRIDLAVPGLPEKTLTIVNIHLEIKCLPRGRELQMAEILSYIKEIRHPVIMIGDFNSAPQDLSPTSAWRVTERTAKDPETWLSVGTAALLPYALFLNVSRLTTRWTKNFQDPTAKHVPVVLPNPVKPLFDMIEYYRFEDGGAFDFRGDPRRSVNGNDGTLANANQRDFKGFKTTFSVKRPIASIIGKYRLDWVFVKSFLKNPKNLSGPYRFAPHYGETLEEMNTSLLVPVSDHHPNVVDLPFEEPLRTESV
jgi:endonuclease/exonuclease/phosphatase family metal-dependent hydrolase